MLIKAPGLNCLENRNRSLAKLLYVNDTTPEFLRDLKTLLGSSMPVETFSELGQDEFLVYSPLS
jgi:hypothetical protein